jgi:hypothetical protein
MVVTGRTTMKHHFNALLQRKRSDFDSSNDMRSSPSRYPDDLSSVEVKDGYDWLQVIKQVHDNVGVSAH